MWFAKPSLITLGKQDGRPRPTRDVPLVGTCRMTDVLNPLVVVNPNPCVTMFHWNSPPGTKKRCRNAFMYYWYSNCVTGTYSNTTTPKSDTFPPETHIYQNLGSLRSLLIKESQLYVSTTSSRNLFLFSSYLERRTFKIYIFVQGCSYLTVPIDIGCGIHVGISV